MKDLLDCRTLEVIESADDFIRLSHSSLQSLRLQPRHMYQRATRITDQLATVLASLSSLTSLRLSDIAVDTNAEEMHFPKLSELEISRCRNWEALFGSSNLAQLTRLQVE